jgi:hypothetical protein
MEKKSVTKESQENRPGESGMTAIKFSRLSMPEAEEVIAEIWNCLEEYGMPSPRIAFDFHGNASVSLQVRLDEPVWARLLVLRLSGWIVAEQMQPYSANGIGRIGAMLMRAR